MVSNKIEGFLVYKKSMSCVWKLFCKSKPSIPKPPRILTDVKVLSPLHLDELPESSIQLEAYRDAYIDKLISIHYGLEDMKQKIAETIEQGQTDRARNYMFRRSVLVDKQKFYQNRVDMIQARLKEIKESK